VLLVSHDRALVDAVAQRTLAIEGRTIAAYDGGWADYVRRRDELRAAAEEPKPAPKREKPAKPRPERPAPKKPSELERVEAEIAVLEERLAGLERELAEDWGDVERLAAHRRARDELQALLARWEDLFEQTQATGV
jgi:ATPase subunit of ABC transporter with duplicated ATPase domains